MELFSQQRSANLLCVLLLCSLATQTGGHTGFASAAEPEPIVGVWSSISDGCSNAELSEKIRTEAGYFERNAERMRYPKFRRQYLFVGSGVIEAGCKTVIGSRLKQSGMFWTVAGANSIIALRCCHLNGRFESYWESRRAA